MYTQFRKAAGVDNDYLVLLGDIMDFAIRSYDEAYELAQAFFLRIQKDGIAKELIYIPGNHDEDIWHTVEHEVNTIDRINNGELPQKFKMSLAGIIDDRSSSGKTRLLLPGVDERKIRGKIGYGGLFLDKITGTGSKETRFNFVYPNLYVISDAGSVLLTHGHYLDTYWTLLSEWIPDILGGDLVITIPMILREMVGINFPSNQLASSGVGQAGPLTDAIRKAELDIRNHQLESVRGYLDRFGDKIAKALDFAFCDPRKYLWNGLILLAKRQIVNSLGNAVDTRYSKEFMGKPEIRERFKRYYQRSCEEINLLNKELGLDIPMPWAVIFGHTHQPVPWNSNEIMIDVAGGRNVKLFNTGGWLTRKIEGDKSEFCGAQVFKYETDEGFSSEAIT